jgi:hypothetical protein
VIGPLLLNQIWKSTDSLSGCGKLSVWHCKCCIPFVHRELPCWIQVNGTPLHMNNSIIKAAYAGLGHCSVCGRWTKLEMWDEGLNGRFCCQCFDHVVDAEGLLVGQGLMVPGPEIKQQTRNSS